MIELILIRHGETTGESSIRLNGVTDVPLSELGKRQARRVGEALAGLECERILVSPLSRSREAARISFPDEESKTAVVRELREIDFGDWETLTVEEVRERDPEGHAAWSSRDGAFRYPGGDSIAGFRARIAGAARTAVEPRVGRTIAVLHKGVIKVILATLLDREIEDLKDYSVELGSIHRLRKSGGRWTLHSASEVEHLGEDRSPEAKVP